MTRLALRTRIGWSAVQPATAILLIRPAVAPAQRVLSEDLEVDNAEVEDPGARPGGGARPLRLHTGTGQVRLVYEATVELDEPPEPSSQELPWLGGLAFDLLSWTLPSRYCPADVLAPTANHLFGGLPRTGALLGHVRDWVQNNIAYVPGTSNVHTAADETMLRRTGVCRDLAHLTATLLRGLDIPARLVGAYALDLDPPDFHAVVEAHDGCGWRLLDATGLAPTRTVTRIATGRDASEIAWGTTDGFIALSELEVSVTRV